MSDPASLVDLTARVIGLAAIFGGGTWAVLRFGFGVGKRDQAVDGETKALKTEISNGFAMVRTEIANGNAQLTAQIADVRQRQDRFEHAREQEAKDRAVAAAREQDQRIQDAIRRTQSEERERALVTAVNDLREDIERLDADQGARNEQVSERVGRLESTSERYKEDLKQMIEKQHHTANQLQDIVLRIARIDKSSGSMQATKPGMPQRDPESDS